jgi:TolA-binding protein
MGKDESSYETNQSLSTGALAAMAAVAAIKMTVWAYRQWDSSQRKGGEVAISSSARQTEVPATSSGAAQHQTRLRSSALPSAEQAAQLYQQGRSAEERHDYAEAERKFGAVAQLYDETQQTAQAAPIAVAASLFRLGVLTAGRGGTDTAVAYLSAAINVFKAAAQTADARGDRLTAERTLDGAKEAGTFLAELTNGAAGHGKAPQEESSLRAQQMEIIRRLELERSRLNEDWARGLGRI